jgi:hypothetical protein
MPSGLTSRGLASGYKILEFAGLQPFSVHQRSWRTSERLRDKRKHRGSQHTISAQQSRTKESKVEDRATEPPQMEGRPGTEKAGSTAEAFSIAEKTLSKLVSGHQGNTRVRHRDKALRSLDFAGMILMSRLQ